MDPFILKVVKAAYFLIKKSKKWTGLRLGSVLLPHAVCPYYHRVTAHDKFPGVIVQQFGHLELLFIKSVVPVKHLGVGIDRGSRLIGQGKVRNDFLPIAIFDKKGLRKRRIFVEARVISTLCRNFDPVLDNLISII